jgi:hypothetical protein
VVARRRSAIRWLRLVLLSCWILPQAGGLMACGSAPVEPRRPILLIVVDTLRADHTSLYGYRRDTTPELKRWLGGGRIFEHAYSAQAATAQSMMSVLSGLLPQEHGVRLLYQKASPSLRLLPDWLRDQGYQTAAVISNFVLTDQAIGLASHFDYYDDKVDEVVPGWEVYERRASDTTDAALRWLETAPRDRPHFLWVHYIDPHGPYTPPDDVRHFHHEGSIPLDPQRVHANHRVQYHGNDALDLVDLYDGEITYVDREIGRLLDGYARLGFADRAVIAFTADHGETMNEFEKWFTHAYQVYEPIIHVPLAIRAPGLSPGRVSTVVSNRQLAAAVMELAGVKPPPPLDPDRLLHPKGSTPIFSGATAWRTQWRCAIRGDRKWVVQVDAEGKPENLFEYTLGSEIPLVGRRAWGRQDAVASELLTLVSGDPDPAGVPRQYAHGRRPSRALVGPDADADTLRKLEALGYVEGQRGSEGSESAHP